MTGRHRRRRRVTQPLAALGVCALLAVGCSASSGTVTAWKWTPPAVQTVDTSCSWWSGSGSSRYCAQYNTALVSGPQVCTLTYSGGAETGTATLNISEADCRSYLGQHYPPGGTTTAG